MWKEKGRGSGAEADKAHRYSQALEPLGEKLSQIDQMNLDQLPDVLETAQDSVDDLWRQEDVDVYPEQRMRQLLDSIGG